MWCCAVLHFYSRHTISCIRMYHIASRLQVRPLQHTRSRIHEHPAQNHVKHFSHEWQSAILAAMQTVLILQATNRTFSKVHRHGTCPNASSHVCSQINCNDLIYIQFEVFRAIKINTVFFCIMTPYGPVPMFWHTLTVE